MKLNRDPKKTDFIGFKDEPSIAAAFRQAAKRKGGTSAVLQRFIRRFIRRNQRNAA